MKPSSGGGVPGLRLMSATLASAIKCCTGSHRGVEIRVLSGCNGGLNGSIENPLVLIGVSNIETFCANSFP
jgi:hypothetical protein